MPTTPSMSLPMAFLLILYVLVAHSPARVNAGKGNGQSCSSDGECNEGRCRGHCCELDESESACSHCADNGKCTFCSGCCVLEDPNKCGSGCENDGSRGSGATCACDKNCHGSGKCRYYHCCKEGYDTGCQKCDGAGNCFQCNAGWTLSGGRCSNIQDPGQSCGGGTNCRYGNCRGGRCCANGIQGSCSSCRAGDGQCNSCSGSYYLAGTTCYAKKNPGTNCGGNVQCTTNDCRGARCCHSGRSGGCSSCGGGGTCNSCSGGWYLDNGQCYQKKGPGGSCSANNWCTDNDCRGGRCCRSGRNTGCPSCGGDGNCNTCNGGYYLDNGNCWPVKDPGGTCNANNWCKNPQDCRTRCCTSGRSGGCQSCGGSGNCDSCHGGYYLYNGQCYPVRSPGETCQANNWCASNNCQDGRCCKSTITSGCTSCESSGKCDRCNEATWYLYQDNCSPKKAPGGTCQASNWCLSDDCRDGQCCKAGRNSGCTSCDSTGDCDVCVWKEWYLNSGNCFTKRDPGQSCSDRVWCKQFDCRGGVCCAIGRTASCTTCGAGGACTACAVGNYLEAGNCYKDKTTGEVCGGNHFCADDDCRGGRCCKTGRNAACSSCDGVGSCDKCAMGNYLNNGQCYAKVPNGGTCQFSEMCLTGGRCLGGRCCVAGMQVHCTECDDQGKCKSCPAGMWTQNGTCCINAVASSCHLCGGAGWCKLCAPGYFLRGVSCVTSLTESPTFSSSASASLRLTMTMSSTEGVSTSASGPTRSSTMVLTATPTFILTETESILPTRSSSATATLTATDSCSTTASLRLSASASATITPPSSSTRSASLSKSSTISASLALTLSSSLQPTASLSLSSSPPTTPSRTSSILDSVSTTSSVRVSSSLTDSPTTTPSPSATLSATRSLHPPEATPAPHLPPGEPCIPFPHRGHLPLGEIPTFEINEATVRSGRSEFIWNITAEWLSLSRWADRRYPLPRMVGAGDFAIVFVPRPDAAPSGTGMSAFSESSSGLPFPRLLGASLELIGQRLVDLPDGLLLSLGPYPGYEIYDGSPEVVEVYVQRPWYLNGTIYCESDAADGPLYQLLAAVVVHPATDPLLDNLKIVTDVIGGAATAGAIMIGSAAGADLADLAIFSDASCAQPASRRVGGSSRILSPMQLDQTTAGMLWGNGILITIGTVFHAILVLTMFVAKRGNSSLTKLCAKLRYPAMTFTLHTVLHPSVTYLSFKLLMLTDDRTPANTAAAVIGTLFAVASPLVTALTSAWKIDAMYMEYDYHSAPAPNRKYPMPHRWVQACLPWGRWEPSRMRRRFGLALSPFCKTHPAWFAVVSFPPSLIALCMAPVTTDRNQCMTQVLTAAVLIFLFALFLFVARPFRSAVANFTAVLSAVLLSFIGISMALQMQHPTSPQFMTMYCVCAMLQVILTAVRVGYLAVSFLVEKTVMRGIARFPKLRRMRWRCGKKIEVKVHHKKGDNRAFFFDIDEDDLDEANKQREEEFFDDLMAGPEAQSSCGGGVLEETLLPDSFGVANDIEMSSIGEPPMIPCAANDSEGCLASHDGTSGSSNVSPGQQSLGVQLDNALLALDHPEVPGHSIAMQPILMTTTRTYTDDGALKDDSFFDSFQADERRHHINTLLQFNSSATDVGDVEPGGETVCIPQAKPETSSWCERGPTATESRRSSSEINRKDSADAASVSSSSTEGRDNRDNASRSSNVPSIVAEGPRAALDIGSPTSHSRCGDTSTNAEPKPQEDKTGTTSTFAATGVLVATSQPVPPQRDPQLSRLMDEMLLDDDLL